MRRYILILILLVLCFNGLDNLRELTDLAIVKAIGIDMTDDGLYKISAIVIDTSEKENNEKGILYDAEGKSVQEAIRHIVDKSPKKLYIGHMETLILSEKIGRENLEETLDFFIRDNEGSNNFYLFIANGSESKDIIKVINEEEISMKQMLLSSSKYRGNSNTKTLNDIVKDILRPGVDILVNSCKIQQDQVVISDMAYFRSWNMLGFLEDNDSIICNMLNNNLENTIISFGDEDNLVVSEIISSKSSISLDNKTNKVKINLSVEANISETGKDVFIQSSKDTDNIKYIIENELSNSINDVLEKQKNEYNTDLIGIGNLLYRKKSPLFNQDYLKNVNTEVKVDAKILNQGGVIKRW